MALASRSEGKGSGGQGSGRIPAPHPFSNMQPAALNTRSSRMRPARLPRAANRFSNKRQRGDDAASSARLPQAANRFSNKRQRRDDAASSASQPQAAARLSEAAALDMWPMVIRVGSACSGMGTEHWALNDMTEHSFQEVFWCEKQPHARKFLEANMPKGVPGFHDVMGDAFQTSAPPCDVPSA